MNASLIITDPLTILSHIETELAQKKALEKNEVLDFKDRINSCSQCIKKECLYVVCKYFSCSTSYKVEKKAQELLKQVHLKDLFFTPVENIYNVLKTKIQRDCKGDLYMIAQYDLSHGISEYDTSGIKIVVKIGAGKTVRMAFPSELLGNGLSQEEIASYTENYLLIESALRTGFSTAFEGQFYE